MSMYCLLDVLVEMLSTPQDKILEQSKLCVTCGAAGAATGMKPCTVAQPCRPSESMKPIQKVGVVVEQGGVREQQLGVWEQQQVGLVRVMQAWQFAPVTSGPTALAWPHLYVVWCLLEHIQIERSLHHGLEADSCRPDVMSERYPTVGAGGLQVAEG